MELITPHLFGRQAAPTEAATGYVVNGCNYNNDLYSNVEKCITQFDAQAYPTCYNYYTDKGCCQSWLSWEGGYFDCLNTAYSNCFNWAAYASEISAFLPCYTDKPFSAPNTAPQAANALTTRSVPALSLEAISYGPMTTTPLHDSIPAYSGTGKLLNEYCNSQHYILLDGPTPYWAPFVGCNQDKADCCPYQVASSTDSGNGAVPTVTVVKTITVNVGPGGVTSAYTGINAYPAAATVAQGTLARCPDDYVSVSGGCCPSGYDLWNAVLGGQVPCYSSLKNLATPPPVPVQNYQTPASLRVTAKPSSSSSTISYGSNKPTSAVVNVVYAVQYPLTPSPGLSTGAKAGIGAGAGVGALVIIGLTAALIWRTKKHKRDKKAFEAAAAGAGTTPMTGTGTGSQAGLASTPRGGGTGTDPSLMSASTAASPGHSVIQTPGSFAPNGGYFPPPPVYNAPMHQQQHHHQQQQQVYYGHHPQEMSSTQLDPHELGGPGQGQLHPDFDPRYHSTPPPSSVSPPPPSEGGHSAQGAGAGTYSELSGQTPRSQVAMPVPVNQTSPMRRPVGASPVPSAISPQTTGGGGGQYVSPQSTGGRQGYGVQEGMYGAPPGMQYHAQ